MLADQWERLAVEAEKRAAERPAYPLSTVQEKVDHTSSSRAPAISAAASQPSILSHAGSAKDCNPRALEMISIMASMIGTATTPFMTAVQNSILIGSMFVALIAAPARVAAATMP